MAESAGAVDAVLVVIDILRRCTRGDLNLSEALKAYYSIMGLDARSFSKSTDSHIKHSIYLLRAFYNFPSFSCFLLASSKTSFANLTSNCLGPPF